MRALVLTILAGVTFLAGGCQSRTIEVEPVHVTQEVEIDPHQPPGKPGGPITQIVEKAVEKGIGPGSVTADLLQGCIQFRVQYQRWPASLAEMAEFTSSDPMVAERLAQLEWIQFRPGADGNLEIAYKTKAAIPVEVLLRLKDPILEKH